MPSEATILFLAGQLIVFLGAVLACYINLRMQLVQIATTLDHFATMRTRENGKLDELSKQISGVSRVVERHETLLKLRSLNGGEHP